MRSMLAQLMLVVMMLTVQTSVADFVEIQGLTTSELRERFDLPGSCEPTIGATRARFEEVTVLISCEEPEGGGTDLSS